MSTYHIQVPNLGYVHKAWQDDQPRFCIQPTLAKQWKTLDKALDFGNQSLTPKLKTTWELWQMADGEFTPVIRAHHSTNTPTH